MAFSLPHPWNSSGRLFLSSSNNASVRANSSSSDVLLSRFRASVAAASSLLGPGRQQEALQGLNECLAGYLQWVRGLEAANRALEEEIAATRLSRAGMVGRKDWEACKQPLAALRKQITIYITWVMTKRITYIASNKPASLILRISEYKNRSKL